MSLVLTRSFDPKQSLSMNAADWAFHLLNVLELGDVLSNKKTQEFLTSQIEQYERDFMLAIENDRAFC